MQLCSSSIGVGLQAKLQLQLLRCSAHLLRLVQIQRVGLRLCESQPEEQQRHSGTRHK